MLRKTGVINHPDGLSARPAALLVQVASRFSSHIMVEQDHKKINGKSIMGVLSLAIKKGSNVYLSIEGDDEEEAMNAILQLIDNNFTSIPNK